MTVSVRDRRLDDGTCRADPRRPFLVVVRRIIELIHESRRKFRWFLLQLVGGRARWTGHDVVHVVLRHRQESLFLALLLLLLLLLMMLMLLLILYVLMLILLGRG